MPEAGGPIILFDAECVLCSANAQFVLRHDKAARFRLASIQGTAGAALCREHGLDPNDPTSILVVDGTKVRRDSDAVLAIYEGLGWPMQCLRSTKGLAGRGRRLRSFALSPPSSAILSTGRSRAIVTACSESARPAGHRHRNIEIGF